MVVVVVLPVVLLAVAAAVVVLVVVVLLAIYVMKRGKGVRVLTRACNEESGRVVCTHGW